MTEDRSRMATSKQYRTYDTEWVMLNLPETRQGTALMVALNSSCLVS